ncbi:receptor-like protein kinase FERONIA isoform X2 [Musa acuminata AAA Group]|uniref:receptor-like protein kinase FERONIA isoform X2 n=1 Tax=Musa acuminata AAA Group TaxID=214697 RepID=UPI0031CE1B7A
MDLGFLFLDQSWSLMQLRSLLCASFAFLLLATTLVVVAVDNSTYYVPRDDILLNCGASGQASSFDRRSWTGDTGTRYAPSLNGSGGFNALPLDPSVSTVPYSTARVFTSPFTYRFPLSAGPIFIRLHFYPSDYSNHAASDAFFSVTSGPYILLHNFSAYLTADALNFAYLIREYSVNVSTGGLNLTFTPSTTHPNSYAFINGIEILSIPDLFSSATPLLVYGDDDNHAYTIDPDQALETVYRLNVGGQAIPPIEDSGLFRSWDDDSPYIYGAAFGVTDSNDPNVTITYPTSVPNYIAPPDVYSTARSMGPNAQVNLNYNLTWILPVDAGFYYLVRLHFCEIQYPIVKKNQRVFDIYLNNQTAKEKADVIGWSGGIGIPVYRDYVVTTMGREQMDLWVALHPYTLSEPEYYDAILNGLEVFKLQNSNNSLAGLNPGARSQLYVDPGDHRKGSAKHKSEVPVIVGGVVGGFAVLLAGFCLIGMCKCQKKKMVKEGKGAVTSNGPYEIKAATNDFDESLLLGVGGFGKVYRGEIDGGITKVAIKRANPMSDQGVHQFQTEIEMLSMLRHNHLVSLIGYCEENCEMILVYDYMAQGTLRENLCKTQKPPLPWKQRLEICIGAARGLHYLHTGAKHTIIHRDVKATNILLDDKGVAKVSDFGLSKIGPNADESHVSTVVKGSFGYFDPEYFRKMQLTEKSDVYSFGVVLFEVLCARPALNPMLSDEKVSLSEWVLHCQKNGMLDMIIDPYLKDKIAPLSFKWFVETAVKCLADTGKERPSMVDVVRNLELALQLQERAEESDSIDGGISDETVLFVGTENKDSDDRLIESSTTTSVIRQSPASQESQVLETQIERSSGSSYISEDTLIYNIHDVNTAIIINI